MMEPAGEEGRGKLAPQNYIYLGCYMSRIIYVLLQRGAERDNPGEEKGRVEEVGLGLRP